MVTQYLALLIRLNYYGHPVARPHLLFRFGRCHFLIPILPVAHPHRMIEFPSLLPLSAFVLGFTFPGSNAKLLHTLQRRIMRPTVILVAVEWNENARGVGLKATDRCKYLAAALHGVCVTVCSRTYVYTDKFLDKKCMYRETSLQALHGRICVHRPPI